MKRFLLIVCLFSSFFALAQQEQHYTQYMVNPYVVNPAIGGTEDFIDVKLGYRTQWVNFGRDNSGPKTMYVSGHTTVGKPHHQYHHYGEHAYWHGVGGYISHDEAGPYSTTQVSFNYAFNMKFTRELRGSIGVFAGLKQTKVNRSWWNFLDMTDPQYQAQYNDAYLSANDFSKLTPDLSVGYWLYTDKWFAGLSAMQLIQNKLSLNGYPSEFEQGTGKMNTHLFLLAGFRLPLTEQINLVPSMAAKYVKPTPLSIDMNVKMDFNDLWFVGVNWRVQDSFALLGGVVIKEFIEVSYSYDFTTTKEIRTNSSGTHEVVIGFRLLHPKMVRCPSKFW